MCKKLVSLILVMVPALAGGASTIMWVGPGCSRPAGAWESPTNWDLGRIPEDSDNPVRLYRADGTGSNIVISTAFSGGVKPQLTSAGTGYSNNLTILSGGSITNRGSAEAYNATATLTIQSGGTWNACTSSGNFKVCANTAVNSNTVTVNVYGTLYVKGTGSSELIITSDSRGGVGNGNRGTVNIYAGGIVDVDAYTIGDYGTGRINIYGPGIMLVKGNVTAQADADISAGKITGIGVHATYDGVTNKTTITAQPMTWASLPDPVSGAGNVDPNVILSWMAGYGAISHDVYIGTNSSDVNSPAIPNATVENNSYDPCEIEFGKIYYWRVDEFDGVSKYKGSIWQFAAKAISGAPAFPGAEGVGKWSVGGRGGTVYEVTNLNDSGAGSLRAAVNASGPRIVVFRVSGTIALLSNLTISNPYITIAGQTAPGDGICLRDRSLVVSADHVIIRYLRSRVADKAGQDLDSISVVKGRNIIVDHCSTSWAIDETLSTSTGGDYLDKVTVQWCLIVESLNCSVHTKGCHGFGTLAKGGYGAQYTYNHNLYAHHTARNPYPGNYNDISIDPEGLTFDFRNNVIYNWKGTYAGYNTQSGAGSVTKMNFVGNYYKCGPESTNDKAFYETSLASRGYFSSNWMNTGYPADPWSLVLFGSGWTAEQINTFRLSSPVPVSDAVTMEDAVTAYQRVLADAGARLPKRDSVDQRIINDVKNGTGRIVDCVDANSFYYPIAMARGGTANTITLAATDNHIDDGLKNYNIEILSGTGAGQIRTIVDYVSSTKVATVSSNWTTIPDATSRYGIIINCTKNAGGWPVLASGKPPVDNDHDGMPDEWEIARGLNPDNASDNAADRDGDGYTNVEEYLNYLAATRCGSVDLNDNGGLDWDDLALISSAWLENNCSNVPTGNLDLDCDVDFRDFAIFSEKWSG